MARPLRIEFPHAFYHVIQRGLEGRKIFLSDGDNERFLRYVDLAHVRYAAVFHTYILLGTHYHLILETPRANLSKIMHQLDVSYAAYFNAKRKRLGPLYQGRFKAILVQEDRYLHQLSRYIHLNPVRAGLVDDPMNYRWSSLGYFITNKRPPRWLNTDLVLTAFDKRIKVARKMYRSFVYDGIGHEKVFMEGRLKGGCILGDDSFFEKIRGSFLDGREDPEIPDIRRLKRELTMDEIKGLVTRVVGDDERLKKKLIVYLSRQYTQRTLQEVADFFGNMSDAAVSIAFKRVGMQRTRDRKLNSVIRRLERRLNVEC